MSGYSGTPLAAKLGIKADAEIYVRGAPDGYLKLLEPLPEGVKLARRLSPNISLVHIFSSRSS